MFANFKRTNLSKAARLSFIYMSLYLFTEPLLRSAHDALNHGKYQRSLGSFSCFFGKFPERLNNIDTSKYNIPKEYLTYTEVFETCLQLDPNISECDKIELDIIEETLLQILQWHKQQQYNDDSEQIQNTNYIKESSQNIKNIKKRFFKNEEDYFEDIGDEQSNTNFLLKPRKIYATTRPSGYPRKFIYQGHLFVFSNKRAHDCKYVCKYGANHHKGKSICKAAISVPYPLMENDFSLVPVTVLNPNHSCPDINEIGTKFIKDAEVRVMVEEFYMSTIPRPTKNQIVSLVLNKIKEETPEGQEVQTVSLPLIYNCFTNLEKMHKAIDNDFKFMLKTKRNTIFERFKYRFGEGNMMICYCSDFQKRCISESQYIFIDGTFDTCPAQFAQVLVMMGLTARMNVPLCYILLPNRTFTTYVTAFTLFKEEVKESFWNGATFITDFEKAEFGAVKKVLMDGSHRLHLCYFHFVQSMNRHFKTYPRLMEEFAKRLFELTKMFPFVSEKLLMDAFTVMDSYGEFNMFLRYFKNNYFNVYEFQDWSLYNKPSQIVITNNVAESHNSVLKREMSKFSRGPPSLQMFEITIQMIENNNSLIYQQSTNTPQEGVHYTESQFRASFRDLIYFVQKGGIIPHHAPTTTNQFSDLINTNDAYFITENDSNTNTTEGETDSSSESDSNNEHDAEELVNEEDPQPDEPHTEIHDNQELHQEKCNIRSIPESARKILNENAEVYYGLPKRSSERKRIIADTFKQVHTIVSNISVGQVRTYFLNYKKK